jgi:hypothetical protein
MNKLANDNEWKPSKKQSRFLSIPYSITEALYGGAVRSGKTDVLLMYPIVHRFHENPHFKGLFLRRTFPELKNEVIPRSVQYYRRVGATFNKNDKVWEFPSGALIFFGHCENESDVHNYDSMQINYAAFDELTSFTEWQYLYITLQRVRKNPRADLPAIVRSGSNPGNIGHTFVRKRFVDPCPDGGAIIEGVAGAKRIFIPATVHDLPFEDDDYVRNLESIPDRAEREAKLYGKWDAFEGQVFDEFRDRLYPDEPTNAIHVIEPIELPDYWPRIVSIDWGYAPPAMTYVIYGAVSPIGRLYVYREQHWQKTKISEWTAIVREFIDEENPREIIVCKSAGQERGQVHTIEGEIETGLGRGITLSYNSPGSRVSGKMLVHEYLRFKQKYRPASEIPQYDDEKANWILRNRPIKEYHAYLDQFSPQPEEINLPKMQIFDTVKLLPEALKACAYDKTNPQDVAEFPGDDPYDAVRYLVDACDKYVNDSEREFNRILAREALLKQLKETEDMTQFYRNMKKLDMRDRIKPIQRYHHARVGR